MDANKVLELFKEQDSDANEMLKKLKEFEAKELELKQKLMDIMEATHRCENSPYDQLKLANEWEQFSEEAKKVSIEIADLKHEFDINRANKSYGISHELIQEMKQLALLQMMREI